jgi:hypothetical protein
MIDGRDIPADNTNTLVAGEHLSAPGGAGND